MDDDKNAELLRISVTPRDGIYAYPAKWNNNTALKCLPHLVQHVITMLSILEFMLVNGQLYRVTCVQLCHNPVRFHMTDCSLPFTT